MHLSELVEPLGKLTYALLWITALTGLNQWKLHWVRLRPVWHYGFAIAVLAVATLHASAIVLSD